MTVSLHCCTGVWRAGKGSQSDLLIKYSLILLATAKCFFFCHIRTLQLKHNIKHGDTNYIGCYHRTLNQKYAIVISSKRLKEDFSLVYSLAFSAFFFRTYAALREW